MECFDLIFDFLTVLGFFLYHLLFDVIIGFLNLLVSFLIYHFLFIYVPKWIVIREWSFKKIFIKKNYDLCQ